METRAVVVEGMDSKSVLRNSMEEGKLVLAGGAG